MEKLKSAVPSNLKHQISESTPADLPSTCSSLLHFFGQLPLFHQIVRDLADTETALCRKNKDASLESKRKGNQCFSNADYPNSMRFYSQALRDAPTDADDMGKNLVSTLYVNRAAVLHKMGLLVECLRDCDRALLISPNYTKAWYRRGKAHASLGNYKDAVLDLTVAMNVELSLGGKRQIESELKVYLGQNKEKSSSPCIASENSLDSLDELHQIKLQCVSTPTKGRGMVSLTDIPQASLLHTEEPYAAIILKPSRDTHCHFCFNKLPVDTVPCPSCTIPLYCSQQCQAQARGQKMGNHPKSYGNHVSLSDDLEEYVAHITLSSVSSSYTEHIAEHGHECEGVNWPAVLPSEIVLAGRVLMKYFKQQRHFGAVSGRVESLELCHNYGELPSDVKLQLHILSVILLHCLQHPCCAELQVNEVCLSQCVILLSQIKVNSMAIVRLNFLDVNGKEESAILSSGGNALTSTVEQVKVGQAIYSAGSLFNHSCRPNIHAYFLSRTLYLRSTEFVAAGSPLELSYGPQVGQWDCKDRQQFLADHYSFTCRCSSCSEVNLSDLVLNAFRCVKPNCFGVVLNRCVVMYENQKVNPFLNISIHAIGGLEPHMQVIKLKNEDISKVAQHLFEQTDCAHQFEPGYCLTCGSSFDLETSARVLNKAGKNIRRLKDAIVSNEVSTDTLSYAFGCLDLLRSTLHAYNKKIAELEDDLAQAFCLAGELQLAKDHCKASIKILEKLYDLNHIVIGNEMVKLTSIQLALREAAAIDSINRMDAIFSQYYGSHTNIIFPHLQCLKREAFKLVE